MKKIKTFEEHMIVNKSDIKNNLSADYYLNIKKGKKPYVKKNDFFNEVNIEKTIPTNAVWLLPKIAEELNKIAEELSKLKEKQKKILSDENIKI